MKPISEVIAITAQVTEKNLPSRNRNVQSEYRKQQMVHATLDCIDRYGLSQTTLANIAKTAGVSQGNLIFHFQNKENLLNQALLAHNKEYTTNWQTAFESAQKNPIAQLCAIIQAAFKPIVCNRKKISVWYAFWGESRSIPWYLEVCGRQNKEFSGTLLTICQQFDDSALSPESAATSIEAMIDGLWQSFIIGPRGFTRQQALATMFELVKVIYPNETRYIDSVLTEYLI